MNCTKCNDTGWLCEKHPDRAQGHETTGSKWPVDYCNEAGMGCDCDAFPHKTLSEEEVKKRISALSSRIKSKTMKKRPREFWIANDKLVYEIYMQERKGAIKVREVVEISDAEIDEANKYTDVGNAMTAFEAGARWYKNKIEGKE